MQEYQQQLMMAQIQLNSDNNRINSQNTPSSPPPTYKSHVSAVRPSLHITFPIPQGGDYPSSRPPTYRSTTGASDRPRIDTTGGGSIHISGGDNHPLIHVPGGDVSSNQGQVNSACDTRDEVAQDSHTGSRSTVTRSPPRPDSPSSSTLHRATEVVGYLDNVLDNTLREIEQNDAIQNQINNERNTQITNDNNTPSEADSQDSQESDQSVTDTHL